jgi:hypothetical protein
MSLCYNGGQLLCDDIMNCDCVGSTTLVILFCDNNMNEGIGS